MPKRILTLRELNRATLTRQNLLERQTISASDVIRQSIGIQAQRASSPYIALWSRLADFQRGRLSQPIETRQIVKATSLRATLHLLTRADYLHYHGAIQPALNKGRDSVLKQRDADFDEGRILKLARDFIGEQPRTFAEISAMLSDAYPDVDLGAMRYTVRTQLALVQVPIATGWSYSGKPQFALAEQWLESDIPKTVNHNDMILRYLGGFGPASVADFQRFTGLKGQNEYFQALGSKLVMYQDEVGRDLYDLPYMPLPSGDTPAPIRFLPEFDNVLLAHDKRTRILDDAYRAKVYLSGLRVRATVLVDGFVRGGWEIDKKRGTATLSIELFAPITASERETMRKQADSLARFIETDAKAYEVKIMDSDF